MKAGRLPSTLMESGQHLCEVARLRKVFHWFDVHPGTGGLGCAHVSRCGCCRLASAMWKLDGYLIWCKPGTKPKGKLVSPDQERHHVEGAMEMPTSLSPRVSSSSSRMVLKCSSHTPRLSSLVILSSSRSAPFRSSTRSLWLESSFSKSATRSEWSMGTGETNREPQEMVAIGFPPCSFLR